MKLLRKNKVFFWIAIVFILKLVLTFIFITNQHGEFNTMLIYTGDSNDYINFALQIINSEIEVAPERVPGYPLFLYLMFLFCGGNNPYIIIIVQHLLYAFTLYVIFRTGILLFNNIKLSLLIMLLYAIDPLYFIFSFRYSTENLSTFFSILSLYYFINLIKYDHHRFKHIILGALFIGLTILSRPIYVLFPVVFSLILFFFIKVSFWKKVNYAFFFGFFSYIVILIWVLVNVVVWDHFGINGDESSKKRYLSAYYIKCIGLNNPYSRGNSDAFLKQMFADYEKENGHAPSFKEKIALKQTFAKGVEKKYWHLYLTVPLRFSYKFFQPGMQLYYKFTGNEEPDGHVNVTTNSEHLEKSFLATLKEKLTRDPGVFIYGLYNILFVMFIFIGLIIGAYYSFKNRMNVFLVYLAILLFLYVTYISAPFIQARYRITFFIIFIFLSAYGWNRLLNSTKEKNNEIQ